MSEIEPRPNLADVEARRSSRSRREMSASRRMYYFLGLPIFRALFFLLTSTYRVQKVIGKENADRIIAEKDSVWAPCYWHQHHILCSSMLKNWISRGFSACFLVSSSVDGEVPDRIARSWGAEVIRGSANQMGALVLRDMQQMMKRGVSIVTTADGPSGPQHVFKPGIVLMARIGGAPMVPLAGAADRAWHLKRWDDFMIPKPFARVVLAVGEPIVVSHDAGKDEMETLRIRMEDATKTLTEQSESWLTQRPGRNA
ncbi:MAG: lysophospholipid acyltransferase family protein [Woeseiaceae bacterium]